MLFKRYLFLAACSLLFIFGFIAYFTVCRAQMDSQFREERERFNDQGVTLTSTGTPDVTAASLPTPVSTGTSTPDTAPMPVTSTPTTTDTSTPATTDASAPATNDAAATPAATDSAAPAMNPAASDPNVIIGPVPPPAATDSSTNAPATTPDASTNAPAAIPAPTDSTTTPMAPSSTRNDSRDAIKSFLVRTAFHPAQGALIPVAATAPAAPVASPVTNAPVAQPVESTKAVSPATNAAAAKEPAAPVAVHPTAGEPSVIVLLYHQFVPAGAHVDPKFQWTMHQDVFESEMKYIHDNNYHVIPMSDLIKFLHHEITLPPNPVVITIDDGYKSAVVYAAPILKQYGYPWTFFIYPDFVTVAEGKGAVSWNDLLALQADGVDIESHSMTHPILTKHTQKWKGSVHALSPEEYDEWLTNETSGSKTLLEQKMGKPIVALAYPYGAYNKEVEAKAIAAGYQYIFTVADNPVHSNTNPHSIGRYTITTPVEKDFIAYLHQGALGLSEADPAPGGTTSNPRPVITAVLGYAGNLDINSIETEVRDFGVVKHDYDPKTSTIRLYLPRDLVQPVNLVNIHVKDAETGKIMVANWHFNYQPAGAAAEAHPPIATETNGAPAMTNAPAVSSSETPMSAATNVAPVTNAPVPAPVVVPATAKPATNTAPMIAPPKPATNAAPTTSKPRTD
jgi:peptidoglycan/xylan/chitin deacetylase (PgdA/CDA1 family)